MLPCSSHGLSLGTTRKHEPGQLVTNVVNDPAPTPHGGVLQAVFSCNNIRLLGGWVCSCVSLCTLKQKQGPHSQVSVECEGE
jgi:hypothetical protein